MRFYISGPMRGLTDFNARAFEHSAGRLRLAGHEAVSPLEMDEEDGGLATIIQEDGTPTISPEDYQSCMARDIAALLGCDAVYVLTGWEFSYGARTEILMAMIHKLPLHWECPPSKETWCKAWKSFIPCGCSSYDKYVR